MIGRRQGPWFLIVALALAGCSHPSRSPPTPSPVSPAAELPPRPHCPAQDLEPALAAQENHRVFHGVALVADGPTTVFSKVAGYADRERGIHLALKSRFVIGSISKQITAVLVMQQVDRGTLDLDAPIGEYLSNSAAWASTVRIRHLLNHTSGIAELSSPLQFEPGSSFAYSNAGYDLLGALIERVSGMSFATATSRLFAFCGMTDTSVLSSADSARRVLGYGEDDKRTLAPVSQAALIQHAPSGGIVSSAEDLVRWNLCLHEKQPISTSSHAALVTPSAERKHRWGTLGYGFGLQVSQQNGITEYSHSGYTDGFIATLAYYPQFRRSLVVLENVSWNADDMGRVFLQHDKLRNAVLKRTRMGWCPGLPVAQAW